MKNQSNLKELFLKSFPFFKKNVPMVASDQKEALAWPQLYNSLFNPYGVLLPPPRMTPELRVAFPLFYAYKSRAEVAFDVCSLFPGGDYFEFGSDSLGTVRNFLTAFNMNALETNYPDTRFYAFDVFGEVNLKPQQSNYEKEYFDCYESRSKMNEAKRFLSQHGVLEDHCYLVQGYFSDTLSPEFKAAYKKENRKIGFAFLDCNITESYKTVFDFLPSLMSENAFVYMDEYFCNPDVLPLFDAFVSKLQGFFKCRAIYMRNAGAFGALFRIMSAK